MEAQALRADGAPGETARSTPHRWPRLVPPRPEPPAVELPTLKLIAAIRTNATGAWPRRAYEEPVLRRRLFGRDRITLNDTDAIRRVLIENAENYGRTPIMIRMLRPILGDGLLISEGADWRHQRRILAPAFTPRAVDSLAPHILASVDAAIRDLDAAVGAPLDLFAVLQHLALEIAGRTMFSLGMGRHGGRLRDFVRDYDRRLGRPRLLDFLLPPAWPTPRDLARARFRRDWTRFLDAVMADRGSGRAGDATDLLDLLSAARDPETGTGFSQADLRDQVATLILAGHETTALTLLWACYLLALAPELQDALAEEAAQAGLDGARDAAPLRRMPLTRAVIDETLRLYPPAFVLVRRARRPDTLAGTPVRAGDIVVISPWLLHRHRRLWRDPDAFDPTRFLPGADPVPRFAYLPFGAGPRVCIGAQFALTEAVLALGRLVGRYRIGLADPARPVLPAAVVTTQPDHAPAFTLVRRDASA